MSQSNATNDTLQPGNPAASDMISVNFFLTFFAILLVATVGGNTLVCLAIYLDRRLRSSTNWLIASLAVADLLYGLVGLPFRIAQTSGTVFSLNECYLWIWVDMVCAAASIANLAVISIDRYLKITKPFEYHIRMTQRRALMAVAGVWVYSAILSSLSMVRWPDSRGVYIFQNSCLNINKVFYTVANIVAFILPLVVLVLNYVMVYIEALKQFKKMKGLTVAKHCVDEKRKQRSIIRDFKATKTLAVVIGTFTICWCPFFILFTVAQYNQTFLISLPHPWSAVVVKLFFMALPNLNSACNPFIYAYFNSEFRRAFKKIMMRLCTNPQDEYTHDSGARRRSSVSFFQALHNRGVRNGPSDASSLNLRHSNPNNTSSSDSGGKPTEMLCDPSDLE